MSELRVERRCRVDEIYSYRAVHLLETETISLQRVRPAGYARPRRTTIQHDNSRKRCDELNGPDQVPDGTTLRRHMHDDYGDPDKGRPAATATTTDKVALQG